jgi:4-hydroxybutyryl-CoA dehydratase / vinylacetyl-CoA-Delta-isomerase
VRVVGRRPDGVVIRGAKLHITAAAFGHDLLVMPTKVYVTNTTYHPRGGDPRDYPVSSRASVPDSVVIFDDVFVPAERVFLDGQADELVGLASLIAEANGLTKVPYVREKIDEMMIHATLLRAGLEAALLHAHATPEGYYYPDDMYTNVAKYHGAANFSTMVRHLHDIAGGAVVTAPSMSDFDNPELRPLLEKYMGTGPGISSEYRSKLFHAIRDLTADGLGGWHHVTPAHPQGTRAAQQDPARRAQGLRGTGVPRHPGRRHRRGGRRRPGHLLQLLRLQGSRLHRGRPAGRRVHDGGAAPSSSGTSTRWSGSGGPWSGSSRASGPTRS